MSADDPDNTTIEAALLAFVLQRHPAVVHRVELDRAFSDVDWPTAANRLLEDGLLYREGALHLASRAAFRASLLLG